MKLTHDAKRNIAYLRFKDEPTEVETLHISDELNIDIAPDGSIHGIELLNANEQLGSFGFSVEPAMSEGFDTRIEVYADQAGEFRARCVEANGEVRWHAGPFKLKSAAIDAARSMTALLTRARLSDLTAA